MVFDVASGDTGEATVDPTTLTFDAGGLGPEKTVDGDGRGRRSHRWGSTTPVTVSVADGSDGAFVDLADEHGGR
ncbi:MAG: hypothetical protein U5R14_05905 [Gemmatimonadota bacterium]|nr:hypothetical protein [Gemmatimonadota bacterium]